MWQQRNTTAITSVYHDVKEAALEWLHDLKSQNLPLDRHVVYENAEVFVEKCLWFGVPDFICSNDQLIKFRSRHNLTFKAVCGEPAGVDPEVCVHWVNEGLCGILSNQGSKIIFNADKTTLYCNMLPEKALVFKNDPSATNCYVSIVMENCSVHCDMQRQGTALEFFPPNATVAM